jgi:hypothetical protein
LLNVTPLISNTCRFLGYDAHVALSALDFLGQSRRRQLARHCLALLATDDFVQIHDRVFQPYEARTGRFCGLLSRVQFRLQNFRTRFELPQLSFEGQQPSPFLKSTRVAGANELAAGHPVAIKRHVDLARGQRSGHSIVKIGSNARIHSLRHRPLQN